MPGVDMLRLCMVLGILASLMADSLWRLALGGMVLIVGGDVLVLLNIAVFGREWWQPQTEMNCI